MLGVLFRHNDFWVVNKPAGLSFHSEEGAGFIETLRRQFPDTSFWPVHRLDKMTSGIVIVATTVEAAARFGALFESGGIEKRYLAITSRKGKKKQGTISGYMEAGRNGCWRLTQVSKAIGEDSAIKTVKMARTQFFSCGLGGTRLFYLRPLSGKTHQLRVAMKSNGSPILGDSRYGGEASDRGYLHAYQIAFQWDDEWIAIKSDKAEGQNFTEALFALVGENFDEDVLKWPRES